MRDLKRFVIIGDMHLPEREDAVQYDTFLWAMEEIKKINPDGVIVAGDITATGEKNAIDFFKEKFASIDAPKVVLLGNSDVRTEENREYVSRVKQGDGFYADGREIICINTPDGVIEESDKMRMEKSSFGAILVMHHGIFALDTESREFLINWARKNKAALILQAHTHKMQYSCILSTEIIGLGTLDPEKAIGTPPCISVLETDGDHIFVNHRFMELPTEKILDFDDFLGISCHDTEKDIDYAIENNIKNIELRKYDVSDTTIKFLADKISQWRKSGGKVLSLHMPDLWYKDGEFSGMDKWNEALKLAITLGADSLTVHVPRVLVKDFKDSRDKFLDMYVDMIKKMPEKTAIAIENLHAKATEKDDENRGFGYTPCEVIDWVDAINERFGYKRAGHNLDVGHARNNPPFRSKYTLGMWYSMLGERIEAYHIHQVRDTGKGSPNHKAIRDWYGELINYFAFFMAWGKNQLNHKPVFLEMRLLEDCDITLKSWKEFKKKQNWN